MNLFGLSHSRILLLLLPALLPWGDIHAQFYNGTQNEFGKNRIQYANLPEWQYFRFEKYDTYFYKNGTELAAYVSESARHHLKDLEDLLDFQLEDKIQFVVYNKQSDFRLSNIGLSSEAQFNIGGATRINGSKVILYYEGDHAKLDRQIRAGLAEILLNQLLFGGNWREVVKNSALLSLPDWYFKGVCSYLGTEWSREHEIKVRDGVHSGKYKNINRLTGTDAVLAGHAVWKYIGDTYGKTVIPNILYMTKVSRNIESGFIFVLGSSLKTVNEEWVNYYQQIYRNDEENKKSPPRSELVKRSKKFRHYNNFKISPDGKYACYTTNEMGQHRLYLIDLSTGKRKRLFKEGHKLDRINDFSYPVTAWHPSSVLLAFVTEKKGEVNYTMYNVETGKFEKRPPLFAYEKILDFSYSDDGKKIVMSAVQKGQTDIFVYTLASNYSEQITRDIYDDMYPRFINNSNQIIFSSNRVDDTLRFTQKPVLYQKMSPNKDLFVYDYKSKKNVLRRVTKTPYEDEWQAFPLSEPNQFTYLSTDGGKFTSRYIARFDSSLAYVDTIEHYNYFAVSKKASQYKRSISEQHVAKNSMKASEVIFHNKRFQLLVTDLPSFVSVDAKTEIIAEPKKEGQAQSNESQKPVLINPKARETELLKLPSADVQPSRENVDITSYRFNFETKKASDTPAPVSKDTLTIKKVTAVSGLGIPFTPAEEFKIPRQRSYFRTFLTDQVVTQFDNNFLNPSYQRFTGSEVYFNPGLTGLMKLGTSDVFEDFRILGGFRLSTDLRSNEFFLSYHDRSTRWDKEWMFYRQSFPALRQEGAPKQLTQLIKYSVRYPFSEVLSLRGALTGRMDRTTYLATDLNNLQRQRELDFWGVGKVELVFDNTLHRGANIMFGTRFKLFAEYFNRLDVLDNNMKVIGMDFRHYTRIHRNLIWANRLAASTSFGPQKLVYYLGSVDNWLNLSSTTPTFNRSIRIADDQNYAFQALAANLRGFNQNIRNGNSFAVINSEVRWPVFSYLLNRPIKSDFISNFQLIAFGDVGSAWTGRTPYSEDNSFNTQVIVSGPITVQLKKQQEPIVGGYGWGMRSKLFGYFVRADWAWGVDDGFIQPRIFYLSISTDF